MYETLSERVYLNAISGYSLPSLGEREQVLGVYKSLKPEDVTLENVGSQWATKNLRWNGTNNSLSHVEQMDQPNPLQLMLQYPADTRLALNIKRALWYGQPLNTLHNAFIRNVTKSINASNRLYSCTHHLCSLLLAFIILIALFSLLLLCASVDIAPLSNAEVSVDST